MPHSASLQLEVRDINSRGNARLRFNFLFTGISSPAPDWREVSFECLDDSSQVWEEQLPLNMTNKHSQSCIQLNDQLDTSSRKPQADLTKGSSQYVMIGALASPPSVG